MSFSPSLPTEIGSYTITITISDASLSSTYTFTLTVLPNSPPTIGSQVLTNQVVPLNSIVQYKLPNATDPEGQSVSTSLSPSLPFINLANNAVTISPTTKIDLGLWTLAVTYSDGFTYSNYPLNVTVTNRPPDFIGGRPSD